MIRRFILRHPIVCGVLGALLIVGALIMIAPDRPHWVLHEGCPQ